MRGATYDASILAECAKVSIHAPHAGRDEQHNKAVQMWRVSIHAPHAGRDADTSTALLPDRGFNPRAPCGARPARRGLTRLAMTFQSTRPMRGATGHDISDEYTTEVSIHAPHAGRDTRAFSILLRSARFNPRAPCGARRVFRRAPLLLYKFQSTRPMRGATRAVAVRKRRTRVSIHAPHAGRDHGLHVIEERTRGFNPRAPCGARQQGAAANREITEFQSTRPMRGATRPHD